MAQIKKARQQKSQATTKPITVFRVSKNKLNIQPAPGKQKIQALEQLITPEKQIVPELPLKGQTSKRRHEDVQSDNEDAPVTRRPVKSARKTLPVNLPTPPASSPEPENLSHSLDDLKSLHRAFLQALSIHHAHHGTRNDVSFNAILPAITRLWKRRTATSEDLERMLAVYELKEQDGSVVKHNLSPWKLVQTGIGHTQQIKIENASQTIAGCLDQATQTNYDSLIEELQRAAQRSDKYAFIFDSISRFPRMECEIGLQTQARKEKIKTIKDTILKQPTTEPDFSKLNISDPTDPPVSREDKLKSRTLSLFDRLKAKQVAHSALGTQATSTEMLRKRALHRIPDIIDTLRLKQSQKLNSMFRSDLHGLPSATRTLKMKVSFSLEQLVQEIKDSSRVPVASEEIRECICLLGREVPDSWCSVYLTEGVKCVTLQGEGWRKDQVKDWCQKEIQRMNK